MSDYDGLTIWTYGYSATGPGRVGKSNISSYSGSISSGINSVLRRHSPERGLYGRNHAGDVLQLLRRRRAAGAG